MTKEKLEMHGKSYDPEYKVWSSAKERCTTETHKKYAQYGGRGIKMCERWASSYQSFIDDMGPRPSNRHTLERNDCNGDYEPQNCRWATYTEQNRNRRGYNCLISYKGKMRTRSEVSQMTGVSHCTIRDRLAAGRTVEEATFKGRLPPRKRSKTLLP